MFSDCFCRLFGLVEISHHNSRTFNAYFSLFSGVCFLYRPFSDNLRAHIGERNTDAVFTIFIQRHCHDRRHRFRQSVSFEEFHLPSPSLDNTLKFLLDLTGKGIRTAEGCFETIKICFPEIFIFIQSGIERRRADQVIGLFLFDQCSNIVRLKYRNHDASAAGHQYRVDTDSKPESVEDREHGQHLWILSVDAAPLRNHLPFSDKVVVGKHDPFRLAGRSPAV